MKYWIVAGVILFAGGAALGQRDPAHPFPNHEEPPANYYCHPANNDRDVATNDHACNCLGMVERKECDPHDEQDEEGNEVQVPATNDTAKCKVYCHKDHCTCKVNCSTS
jgi:hypothetical protein